MKPKTVAAVSLIVVGAFAIGVFVGNSSLDSLHGWGDPLWTSDHVVYDDGGERWFLYERRAGARPYRYLLGSYGTEQDMLAALKTARAREIKSITTMDMNPSPIP